MWMRRFPAITRPIKGSCDTNRNLRDPTKALGGSQNFKLRDRLQNKNSEPKSSALAPKKIIRAKKFGSGSKKNKSEPKSSALAPKKIIRAKKLGSGSKKKLRLDHHCYRISYNSPTTSLLLHNALPSIPTPVAIPTLNGSIAQAADSKVNTMEMVHFIVTGCH